MQVQITNVPPCVVWDKISEYVESVCRKMGTLKKKIMKAWICKLGEQSGLNPEAADILTHTNDYNVFVSKAFCSRYCTFVEH